MKAPDSVSDQANRLDKRDLFKCTSMLFDGVNIDLALTLKVYFESSLNKMYVCELVCY